MHTNTHAPVHTHPCTHAPIHTHTDPHAKRKREGERERETDCKSVKQCGQVRMKNDCGYEKQIAYGLLCVNEEERERERERVKENNRLQRERVNLLC